MALHFTLTGSSWLNVVELITRQAIRRGSNTSVRDMSARISAFIDGWNDRWQFTGPWPSYNQNLWIDPRSRARRTFLLEQTEKTLAMERRQGRNADVESTD